MVTTAMGLGLAICWILAVALHLDLYTGACRLFRAIFAAAGPKHTADFGKMLILPEG